MKQFLLSLLVAASSFAAISGNTVFEMRPTNGVDTNGGGFVFGASGTDYSQQNAAQYGFATLASSNGTTNPCIVSDTNHNFVATDVGNIMHINSGTNWTAGFYQIVSVSSNNATLDKACGSAASLTAGTYSVGGALKTFNTTFNALVGGNVVYIKAESTITTASALTMGQPAAASGTQPAVIGYSSSRGDEGQVTFQATAGLSNNPVIQVSSTGLTLANLIIDCNSQANTPGVSLGSGATTAIRGYNLKAMNCTTAYGIQLNGEGTGCIKCYATANTISGTTGGAFVVANSGQNHYCFVCVAVSNTANGITSSSANQFICVHCISGNNSGAQGVGFKMNAGSGASILLSSTSFGNSGDGVSFSISTSGSVTIMNTVSYGNTGKDFNNGSTIQTGTLAFDYNAYRSGQTTNTPAGSHDKTISVDPFVASGSNNFALNNTANAGAALQGAGFPGVLTLGGTGSLDIGAVQHAGSVTSTIGSVFQ